MTTTMAMGRGSAIIISGLILLFCLTAAAHAATFTVGDAGGWTFNTSGWPQGKTFMAGDTLVFNYKAGAHNVVVVDKRGYDACRPPEGAKIYVSGKDEIKLVKGQNFFICDYVGHCESAMKIAVNAL